MKNYLSNLLALLVCAALLCGALAAVAEEMVLDLPEIEMEEVLPNESEDLGMGDMIFSVDDVELTSQDVEANPPEEKLAVENESNRVAVDDVVYEIVGNEAVVLGRQINSEKASITIQEKVSGYPVTRIKMFSFYEDKYLVNLIINAHINIWDTTTFSYCKKLQSITINGEVKSLPTAVFKGCPCLNSVTINGIVHEIDFHAFEGCTALESIVIPKSVEKIGSYVFKDCTSLASVEFQNGLHVIGESMFENCTALKSIRIPGSIDKIEDNAFMGCEALSNVDIQEGVKEIGFYSFAGCISLKSITIPASVTFMDYAAVGYAITIEEDGVRAAKKIDGFIIRGQAGSAAEEYAVNYGFEFDDGTIKPTKITITNGKTISVDVDSKKQLYTELTPANAETTLTWTSSDESIATVSAKGLVKGIKKGSATITVTTKNGKTALIKVKVVAPVPTKVIINQGKSATLYMGNTLKLTTKFAPAKAESKLTWSSSKPAIATVSDKGVVTPKKAGTAKITVKTANGKKANITVKVVDAKSVKLKEGKSKTLKVGKKLTLHATVSPAKVKTKLTWTSSDTKVATVSGKGVVTAKKAGTAKITVKTANGKSATITITVK